MSLVLTNKHSPLNCRGGCYFCLDTKVTKKSSQQRGFFAALPSPIPNAGLALQNNQNHGLQKVALLRSLHPQPSANICYAPTAAPPTIVLIAFTRNLSADGKVPFYIIIYLKKRIRLIL
ncbi:hypothetical protein [Mucilaginibacter sp. NFR10]|uniref:hypothetical protein n=1 Tax=Mucilaginibacter sp. NFR10 TaxID=1566292 RepID=UPI000B853182|nr:hypothetical protein [Mucilaginibacter sp. NFR10]